MIRLLVKRTSCSRCIGWLPKSRFHRKQPPNQSKCGPTLSASSLIFRLFIRLFQSSLVFATLALIPSTLSLDTTTISSSPLAATALSLAWPCSLSLRNSCGDTQTKELWLCDVHTELGGCESKSGGKKTDNLCLSYNSDAVLHWQLKSIWWSSVCVWSNAIIASSRYWFHMCGLKEVSDPGRPSTD